MTNEQIKEIINAEKLMEDNKKLLLPYYIEQYGSEYSKIIEQRLKNTFYLVEDFPDVKYKFLKGYYNLFDSQQEYDNMVLEYLDYIEVSKSIKEKYEDYDKWLLAKLYGVNKEEIDKNQLVFNDEIIKSFGSFYVSLLENSEVENETKLKIKNLQGQYLKEGYSVGGNPKTDCAIVDDVLNSHLYLRKRYYFDLLETSLWGKRLSKKLIEKSNGLLNQNDAICLLINSICQSYNMSCNQFSIKNVDMRIISFPIFKNYMFDLNYDYYHEMRHAVENVSERYKVINEIRVDKHATIDYSVLPKVFKNLGGDKFSIYSQLDILTNGLFDKYASIFNQWAVTYDCGYLESLFSYENLVLYEDMLSNVLDMAINGVYADISKKPYIEHVNKMVKRLENS